ncbi:MAG: hypothetical protein JWN56_1842 [Sphingobacteriales bacterium]|nr:hypothetical protein [Sphingobacteriales bacterium]
MFLSSLDASGKIIEFNIEAATDIKNKEIKEIKDKLVFHLEISHGKVFKRQDNGDLWYINSNATIARFITLHQFELIQRWNNQILLPNEEQLFSLSSIGGLPSSEYSLYPRSLEFPATIVTTGGKRIDMCIFHFCEAPPFQSYLRKTIMLSDIAEISPSELALSHNLRMASTRAEEIRMSFYPFMVLTNKGKLITYDGTTQFASKGEIKGNEIISEVAFSYEKFDKIKEISYDDITFVIGKWDDRIECLFNKYQQQLAKPRAPI